METHNPPFAFSEEIERVIETYSVKGVVFLFASEPLDLFCC